MEKTFLTNNGVTIYAYPNGGLHSFCYSLYIKAGPLYEKAEENGISHFLEHITIRNVNALMNGELYRTLDRLGLSFNAYTYKEMIQITMTGSCEQADKAAEIFATVFGPLVLKNGDISLERGRIKAEIREDDDKSTLDFFTNGIVWSGTPLERTITGSRSVLDKIGVNRLAEAKRSLLSADNIFVYLTGNVTDANVAKLSDEIEKYDIAKSNLGRENVAAVPADMFSRDGKPRLKNDTVSAVRFSFDFDSTVAADSVFVLLFDILFEGDNCKMYQELSEKTGLIYSYTPFLERYRNVGSLYFSYEVAPQKLYETVEIAVNVLKSVKNGLTDELDYVIAPYTKNHGMLLDTPDDFNWTMAYESHILGDCYKSIDDRIAGFSAVTADDIVKLANRIFTRNNMTITLKGNKNSVDLTKIAGISAKI